MCGVGGLVIDLGSVISFALLSAETSPTSRLFQVLYHQTSFENNSCYHVIQTKPFVLFHSFCFYSKRKCCVFAI